MIMKHKNSLKALLLCFVWMFLLVSAGILPASGASEEIINLTDLYGNGYTASSEAIEGDGQHVGPADKAFDNQAAEDITPETIAGKTRWAANTTADTWLEVEFIHDVTITGFQINECKLWGNITSFEIQAYADGVWKTIYTGTETSNEACEVTTKISAQKVRLYVKEVAADRYQGVTILEMDYFGTCGASFPQNLGKMPLSSYLASTIEQIATNADLAFDGDPNTRWATAKGDHAGAYLQIDFMIPVKMNGFQINECTTWGNITSYEIQYWDGSAWKTAYTGEQTLKKGVMLSSEVTTQKVRLLVNGVDASRYDGVSIFEFYVFGAYDSSQLPRNLAASVPGVTYAASSVQTDEVAVKYAFDQDLWTRWGSAPEDAAGSWIEVTFPSEVTVEQLQIFENKTWGNVTGYSVQCFVNGSWKTVHEGTELTAALISLPTAEVTNKVRIHFAAVAPDRYQGVTLWEVGIYGIGPAPETNIETGSESLPAVGFAAATVLCAAALLLRRLQAQAAQR